MNYESFISTIYSRLQTYLIAEIAKINAVKTDIVVPAINEYITGYPDTDAHTADLTFYMLPCDFTYEFLSNQSREQTTELKLYCIITGNTSANRQKFLYRYMEALYEAIDNNKTFNGYIDLIYLSEMKVYEAVEGNENCVAFEATCNIIEAIQ